MRIAVIGCLVNQQSGEGYRVYLEQILRYLAQQHAEHQFLLINNPAYSTTVGNFANVTPVVVKPSINGRITKFWWYQVTLPLLLRRLKADVFVGTQGSCSFTTRVPQVLVLPGNVSLKKAKAIRRCITRATAVVTTSHFLRNHVLKLHKVTPGKVLVVPGAPDNSLEPLEWEAKERIKEQYAEGCEYFVFTGGFHPGNNLLTLLKAFSLFKKRQQTNMKLLVTGDLKPDHASTMELIESYRFRKGVILLGYLPRHEYVKVLAGAYALVYPGYFENIGMTVMEAMSCGVPVIGTNTAGVPEVVGDTALLVDPTDATALAEHMKRLFKDENFRATQVKRGLLYVERFNWELSAREMWSAIEQTVSK